MKSTLLVCSANKEFLQTAEQLLSLFGPESLVPVNAPEEVLAMPTEAPPAACLVDGSENSATLLEWIQTLRMSYEKTIIIVLYPPEVALEFDLLKKNGANYLMHAQFDREFIVDLILEETAWDFGGDLPLRSLQALYAEDLPLDAALGFDVFTHLPHNKKTIQLRRKGGSIDAKSVEKMTTHGQNLYFKKADQKKVLEYLEKSSESKSEIPHGIAASVKAKRIFYDFMSEFFDPTSSYDSGKKIYAQNRQIVNDLGLLKERPASQWRELIERRCGKERSFYEEALNLAHFAAAFGHLIGLKTAQIESLALAGLLHNIGLSKVRGYSLGMDPASLPPDQLAVFRAYPDASSNMIKIKKVPLPAEVTEIILQHRERGDGAGFPQGIARDKFHELTLVFQIAYRFQEITSLEQGDVKRMALPALEFLKDQTIQGKELLDVAKVAVLSKKFAS